VTTNTGDDRDSRPDPEDRQQEVWAALGAEDPDWAVLTEKSRRHGGWDNDLTDFYASGVQAVDECLAAASPAIFGRAVDYGAGTGRLSFALAAKFDHVTSVDISPGMLSTLQARAATAKISNITTATPSELAAAGEHDFAMSLLVLQHLPSLSAIDNAIGIIASSLAAGAPAVIELPESVHQLRARLQPRFQLYRVLRSLGVGPERLHRTGLSGISMRTVPAKRAELMFANHGLQVVNRVKRPDHDYDYVRWVVRRA
jgi:predicted TPR repeat methyltransferase